MMRRTLVLGSCLAVALGATGCQDPVSAPAPAHVVPGAPRGEESAAPEDDAAGVDWEALTLPSSALLSDGDFADAARDAIDPADYVCTPSSPVLDWYRASVLNVRAQEPAIFTALLSLRATSLPMFDALYLQTDDTPQYFGYNGEYTHVLRKTERDAKRFWDIYSDDIQLIGMHGTMLQDAERVAATYQTVFRFPPALAAAFASRVGTAVRASQTLEGGNHPLFSFNAFALTTNGGPIPDKIVMGDGILAGYEAVGFGDVAPQAIYAHEFAHHIQFENGYFRDPYATAGDRAERTRYTELMADALSAYYLTHKRGATMNRKRVEQFLQVFFQIGDCGFRNPGHHGTPNQRMAAARFGFELAHQAHKQGHILSSAEAHARFVAAYPRLIAPDAR